MSFLFNGCLSLAFIPDITKWDVKSVIKNEFMFWYCYSISKVPDIFSLNKMNDIQIFSFIGKMNLNKNESKLECINDVNYNK